MPICLSAYLPISHLLLSRQAIMNCQAHSPVKFNSVYLLGEETPYICCSQLQPKTLIFIKWISKECYAIQAVR